MKAQIFPDEIIDLIVANTDIDFVATFILVCKRYLCLLDKGQFLYMKETPFDCYKNEYAKIYRNRALYQNPFTKIPSQRKMIKYIPFYHPKFDKSLLNKKSLSKHKYAVRKLQDLKSIKIYNKIVRCEHMQDLRFVYNYNYDVFCELVINPPTNETIPYIYNGAIFTHERLDFLLANKILCEKWDRFMIFSSELDMCKRIYQMHVDNEVRPMWTRHIQYILSVKVSMAEWMTSIMYEGIDLCKINRSDEWNVETVIYLYEKGVLSNTWIWENIPYSRNFGNILINSLSAKIPFPTLGRLPTLQLT